MQRLPRTTSILLTLCLVLVQVQVWASAGLGCRLEADAAPAAPCALHRSEAPPPGKTHPGCLLDCQRCALHCALGVAALPPSAPLLFRAGVSEAPEPTAGRHYYRFFPDSHHRPPIA